MKIQSIAALLLILVCCRLPAGDLVMDVDPNQLGTLDTILPSGTTAGSLLEDSPDFKAAIGSFREGDFDAALKALEATHASFSQLPSPKVMLGILLLDVRRTADARAVLEQAHRDAANEPALYRVFGDLALAEGRLTDSYVHYEKAWRLARGSEWTDAQKNFFRRHCILGMSRVEESRGDWETAQRYLEEALKIDANDVDARQRFARALFSSGDSAAAFEQMQAAVAADSQLEPAELFMARFAGTAGKDEETEGWLQRAAKQHPSDTRVLNLYASWLLDQGRAAEAWTHASAAAKLEPESNEILMLLGTVYRFLKQDMRAEQCFEQVHRVQPANFQASNQLAQVLAEQEDVSKRQRALQLAEINVRQYPQLVEALATLGWVYFQVGQLEPAEGALSKAMSPGRSSSDTAYYMARVLAARGRTDEAQKLVAGAIEARGRFLHRDEAQAWINQLASSAPAGEGPKNE